VLERFIQCLVIALLIPARVLTGNAERAFLHATEVIQYIRLLLGIENTAHAFYRSRQKCRHKKRLIRSVNKETQVCHSTFIALRQTASLFDSG
jgi:hypothetical protein